MTEKELDVMESLWREGLSAKRIASETGYCVQYIYWIANRYRDRFPYRRHIPDPAYKELIIERVLAGRMSITEASRKLNIHYESVRKVVRKREQEARMAEADRTVQEV